jgi:hypothetical protein
LTYNSHVLEASIVLIIAWLLLRYEHAPQARLVNILGILVGLLGQLHPLTGIVFAGTVTCYFFIRGGDHGWRFISACCLIVMLGLGLNYALYDTFIPFYFQPTLYLYGPSPAYNIPASSWLAAPIQPGLTEASIITRFRELHLSEHSLNVTLALFRQYQDHIRNPIFFAWEQWRQYDVLTFTPLVMMAAGLVWRAAWNKKEPHQHFYAWIVASSVSLYLATITLHSAPGASFGNRHLIPVLPLLIIGAAHTLSVIEYRRLWQALVWVSFAIIFPGTLAPWLVPHELYLAANRWLWVVTLILLIGYASRLWLQHHTQRLLLFFKEHQILASSMVSFLVAAEWLWYAILLVALGD